MCVSVRGGRCRGCLGGSWLWMCWGVCGVWGGMVGGGGGAQFLQIKVYSTVVCITLFVQYLQFNQLP